MAKKKAAPAPEQSVDDLLGQLEIQIAEAPKQQESKCPVMDEDTTMMLEYAGVHAVFKIADERKKLVGAQFKEHLWKKLTDTWFDQGTKPSNPKIVSKLNGREDCAAIFQVKAAFNVKAIEGNPSGRGAVTQALGLAGFDPDVADQIYDENLDVEVITSLRPFNELSRGKYIRGDGGSEFVPATDVQKSAARKLLLAVTGNGDFEPLTSEERTEVIVRESRYVVKAGFLERAATYCDSSEELRKLLSVIEPQLALSGVKFAAASANEREEHLRTLNVMREMLGLEDVDLGLDKAVA